MHLGLVEIRSLVRPRLRPKSLRHEPVEGQVEEWNDFVELLPSRVLVDYFELQDIVARGVGELDPQIDQVLIVCSVRQQRLPTFLLQDKETCLGVDSTVGDPYTVVYRQVLGRFKFLNKDHDLLDWEGLDQLLVTDLLIFVGTESSSVPPIFHEIIDVHS